MSRRKQREFGRELDKLYKQRTQWLRSRVFGKKPGKPPKMTRKKITKSIHKLQNIASAALADDLAKTQFEEHISQRKSWHPKRGKGHGRGTKKARFKEWYEEQFGRSASCIYVFWVGRSNCLYVGKTTRGRSRPAKHFEVHWFSKATRIDIYVVPRLRALPKLECLAIHRFQPSYNKQKAETKKWTSACPLCAIHRNIESELRDIFALR